MSDACQDNQLIVYSKAIEVAGEAISLVRRVPAPVKSLADQVIRSASSVPANIADFQPPGPGARNREQGAGSKEQPPLSRKAFVTQPSRLHYPTGTRPGLFLGMTVHPPRSFVACGSSG